MAKYQKEEKMKRIVVIASILFVLLFAVSGVHAWEGSVWTGIKATFWEVHMGSFLDYFRIESFLNYFWWNDASQTETDGISSSDSGSRYALAGSR